MLLSLGLHQTDQMKIVQLMHLSLNLPLSNLGIEKSTINFGF